MIGDRKTEDVFSTIEDTTTNIESTKSTQFIGGSSFVTYLSNTGNQYDFAMSVPQSYKTAMVTFTYTSGASDIQPIITPTLYFRIDNPDVMSNPLVDSNGSTGRATLFQYVGGNNASSWIIQFTNIDSATHTFYLKFYFYGTTAGTFNIVAL